MVEESLIWSTPEDIEEEMDELKDNHPQWSERVFLHWAAETYLKIDNARRSGGLANVKEVMTPSCFKKLDTSAGPPLHLQGVQIHKVGREGANDSIDVRFVSERDAGLAIEYLRFVRPSYEADSRLGGAPTVSEICPHCGARRIDPSNWECEYCATILAPQSVGWTIEAIFKEGEYSE